MTEYEAGVAQAAIETFTCPEPILELGSYLVPGQESVADLRKFFPESRYLGVDKRSGKGVDSVEDVERLAHASRTVGTVLAFNCFEHVPHFWTAFEEVKRVLRPDGLLISSCPFYFHIHSFPNDYWRFTPEAFRLLLESFPSKIIGWHGPAKRPLSVWSIAAGPDYPPITGEQHTRFRRLIRSYARQPLNWDKRFRYRVGRLLCGRGPFSIFLEAEDFDTVLINGR
jgi:SAM-dependent methyltransferase